MLSENWKMVIIVAVPEAPKSLVATGIFQGDSVIDCRMLQLELGPVR